MKLEVSNKNYCCSIVRINKLVILPKCDNIQHAIIFGNSVIVSKDLKEGDTGLFFPLESKLSQDFLKNNNLYHDNLLNKDTTKKGFFESKGRVKCCKMRGHKSEGFFASLNSLDYLGNLPLSVGQEFNSIDGIIICEKYVIEQTRTQSQGNKKKQKQAVKISRICEGQFRFHLDTGNLRREINKLNPDDIISVSQKIHGTSFVAGKVLVKHELTWKDRIAALLGVSVIESYYDEIWASRKVIKSESICAVSSGIHPNHFYDCDIWGIVAGELKDIIPENITVYGEICGFLPSGAAIQSITGGPFDYGCQPKEHEKYIYRITLTTDSGKVYEFSWPQIVEFCSLYGLKTPPLYYHGKAKDMYPELDVANHWHENFLLKLEAQYMKDQDCPLCYSKVPFEGIVVSVDSLYNKYSLKLKTFRFLEKESKELDKGILDIETSQSIEEEK